MPLWGPLRASLSYAVVATLIAVVVGGLAACAIAYARRGGPVLAASMLPLGTSAVTLGFGLLVTFAVRPVDLRGSWIIVPIGQALVAVPLVVQPCCRCCGPSTRGCGKSPRRWARRRRGRGARSTAGARSRARRQRRPGRCGVAGGVR
ncbi:MAG: hypothetical protein U0S36_12190 [Candidatus Nanopelagicales bacterium]